MLEIAGLGISKKDPKSQFGQGLSPMKSPGLEVDIYFQLPEQTVLSLDQKQSKVTITTDQGTELSLAEMFDGYFQMRPGEDASTGVISIKSDELPDKKVNRLKLDGTLVLNVGRDLKTTESDLKLAEGTKIKLGTIDATVGQVGEAYNEPFKQSVELSSKKAFDSLAKIEFLDNKGNVIESGEGGSSSFGFGDDMTYSRTWQIASDAKAVKVKVSYHASSEAIKVPCKLEFGLGL